MIGIERDGLVQTQIQLYSCHRAIVPPPPAPNYTQWKNIINSLVFTFLFYSRKRGAYMRAWMAALPGRGGDGARMLAAA